MGSRDPRVDAYIDKAAPFAQPILRRVREVVHEACPGVEETIKWSRPHFMYHGLLCGMAAFKAHCAVMFWQGGELESLADDPDGLGPKGRLTSLDDLPSKKVLLARIKAAAALNAAGEKPAWVKARSAKPRKPALPVPADLKAALATNAKAKATFEAFAPSHRREYIEWITSAKQEATRARRLAAAVAQMAEGKSQNWKYERS